MTYPWDYGLTWHLEQVEAPDVANDDTLTLAVVRDDHLRGANGTAEDDYIERLMLVSYAMAERHTWRAHLTQTWDLVLSRFPTVNDFRIVFDKPPLQDVTSIVYINADGDETELLTSPSDVQVVTPSGPKAAKGYITPMYGASWPSVMSSTPGAVRIRFVAGYPVTATVPGHSGHVHEHSEVPVDIDQGRLLVIGEMYKTRSESVIGTSPALHLAKDIWREYRAW